ncbi:MAG TPA: YjbE family putative metal transport protein [Bryobacteraceae bacterium]|nr:YjbE family putative metal transport protein [Bryobacteraceae bacterium]
MSPPTTLPHFLLDGLSIILIDLLLAGDNALVIAMAVRSLPPRQRRAASAFGAAAAVALRVAATIAAAQLFHIQFVKLLGGAFVIWIAVKVFVDASAPAAVATAPRRWLQAIWFIVVADITMSTDNILAIAGASHGNIQLIIFGLGLSIPFVVFASNLIAVLMDRYPWTVYLGSAILGKVGGEMMLTDPVVVNTFHPSQTVEYLAQALAVAGILIAGRILSAPAGDRGTAT